MGTEVSRKLFASGLEPDQGQKLNLCKFLHMENTQKCNWVFHIGAQAY